MFTIHWHLDNHWSRGLSESVYEPLESWDPIVSRSSSSLPASLVVLRIERIPNRLLANIDGDMQSNRNVFQTLGSLSSTPSTHFPSVGYFYFWNCGAVRFHSAHPAVLNNFVKQWFTAVKSNHSTWPPISLVWQTMIVSRCRLCMAVELAEGEKGMDEVQSGLEFAHLLRLRVHGTTLWNKVEERAILLMVMEKRYKRLSVRFLFYDV